MSFRTLTATAVLVAGLAAASAASAQAVQASSLANINTATATTTSNANGKTTTATGSSTPTTSAGAWGVSNLGAGATVGITKTYTNDGNGAAYFGTTGSSSKGDLVYKFAQPVLLSNLTSLSFDFYRDPSSNTGDAFAPVLRLMMTEYNPTFGFDAGAGSLVLEYFYQGQSNPTEGAWTTVSANLNSGIFWATNTGLGPTQAAANGGQKNLNAWIAANNTLKVTGVNIGVGSGWSGNFTGAVDHVQYAFTGGPSANFDFQVAGVPEPATWAIMIGGAGLAGAALRRQRARAAATA